MGKRVVLGAAALMLAVSGAFMAASAPAESASMPTPSATPTAPKHEEHLLDPGLADVVVAGTTLAAPEKMDSKWASCDTPITIDYAAGPGIDPGVIPKELAYPVRYLQDLGYDAAVGVQVPYVLDAPKPTTVGTVLLVATMNPAEQPDIAKFRASTTFGDGWPHQANGKVNIDANTGLSSLVILHELGHMMGLGHKETTVMSTNGTRSNGFDGAETAAIDCRG